MIIAVLWKTRMKYLEFDEDEGGTLKTLIAFWMMKKVDQFNNHIWVLHAKKVQLERVKVNRK